MRRFDVCNGDADGLCAVRQWRLHQPAEATLVTGLKRDIELLARVDAGAGDEVLVCDISLDRNRAPLLGLLERGVRVRWFDHHAAGPLPDHPNLAATIDTAGDTCTSLLVDRALGGAQRAWAIVGAYGDNLTRAADVLADGLGLDSEAGAALRRFGEAMNYNAYGDEGDVRIAPAALYAVLARHADPLAAAREPVAAELVALREADLARAQAVPPAHASARAAVYLLPEAGWARRVAGSFANERAHAEPARAHAVLTRTREGDWRVSLRSPLDAASGADALCRRFGGRGRAGAAGIDRLADAELDRFVRALDEARWQSAPGGASC